jgi:hypothetical protein
MKGTVQYEGSSSDAFNIYSGVKQGCILAPTLFGIFFAGMLKRAFNSSTDGIYMRTRSDGKLFNLSCLKAKTKVREALIRDLLFADHAALASHTENQLQIRMSRFSEACREFSLTISLKKTEVMGQNVDKPPEITISNYVLSLEAEINRWMGRASTTFVRLTRRMYKLTTHTKNTSVWQ